MDKLLEKRYETLFRLYGIGGSDLVRFAKHQIQERIEQNSEILRPDGAYFLLVNIDHMVIRACVGYIPDPDSHQQPVRREDALPGHINSTDVPEKLRKSLDVIFDDLQGHEKAPFSAHAIVRTFSRKRLDELNLWEWI